MCDTEERGGQCLNVTAFLFAVNYGRGQGIGSVTRQSKHFLAQSEDEKRGAVFVSMYLALLPSKINQPQQSRR